jgi:hypothetical protein
MICISSLPMPRGGKKRANQGLQTGRRLGEMPNNVIPARIAGEKPGVPWLLRKNGGAGVSPVSRCFCGRQPQMNIVRAGNGMKFVADQVDFHGFRLPGNDES